MSGFWLVLLWVGSLLVSTFLGLEKGRWETGFGLGLLFGPLGVLAAGLMQASADCEAQRRYEIEKQVKRVQRDEAAKLKERREEAHSLAEMVTALESQLEDQRNPLAEGLDNLANKLDEIARHDPAQELLLRSWIAWLNRQSLASRENDQRVA